MSVAAVYILPPLHIMRCTGVNGWIGAREDFMSMWQHLDAPDTEHYALVWETEVRMQGQRAGCEVHQ